MHWWNLFNFCYSSDFLDNVNRSWRNVEFMKFLFCHSFLIKFYKKFEIYVVGVYVSGYRKKERRIATSLLSVDNWNFLVMNSWKEPKDVVLEKANLCFCLMKIFWRLHWNSDFCFIQLCFQNSFCEFKQFEQTISKTSSSTERQNDLVERAEKRRRGASLIFIPSQSISW